MNGPLLFRRDPGRIGRRRTRSVVRIVITRRHSSPEIMPGMIPKIGPTGSGAARAVGASHGWTGTSAIRRHAVTIPIHVLLHLRELRLLSGREEGIELPPGFVEDLGGPFRLVTTQGLKLQTRGVDDRLDLRLLVGGQVQVPGQTLSLIHI